jgi:predicted membrane-bound spermidine synthase
MAAVLFASLLWPTFFMGVSLPLLARSFTENVELAASRVGALYGINTLGAAAGALITTWLLLPQFGLGGACGSGRDSTSHAQCSCFVCCRLGNRQPLPLPPSAIATPRTTFPSILKRM